MSNSVVSELQSLGSFRNQMSQKYNLHIINFTREDVRAYFVIAVLKIIIHLCRPDRLDARTNCIKPHSYNQNSLSLPTLRTLYRPSSITSANPSRL